MQEALADWIQTDPRFTTSPAFLTVTFARPLNPKYPESALRPVAQFLRKHLAHPTGFLGAETVHGGHLHVHGLISNGVLPALHRRTLSAMLNLRFGLSKVEAPRGIDSVARYVAKYVTKDLAAWEVL